MKNLMCVRNAMFAMVLCVASTASAAPTIWGYFYDGASGNKYEDCYYRTLYSQGHGTDDAGNYKCMATQNTTGSWKVTNGSCTGATKHKAMLRGNFLVYCESALTSWTTQTNCAYSLLTKKNAETQCVTRTLGAYSQGTL